ncbi:hypothetical protein OIU77_028891 [Salix suchowensis]|uniref:Uncharacterized protein n=1 Tax=Salix suchowensis TaxID=1278906 RepID=A0ABQ9BJ00_9ROSI|nr:hypothetical protein OIU77_028891 [Salix suchowensis]
MICFLIHRIAWTPSRDVALYLDTQEENIW